MHVHLAGLEGKASRNIIKSDPEGLNYGLASYFYIRTQDVLDDILISINKHLLIDSGAFSFMNGKSRDFDEYVKSYISFIKANTDNPKIEGFFEMDIDSVVGYEKVKEYRKMLEAVSDKIIPVWHANRGIDDYIQMCKDYKGKKISISTLHGDIDNSQYNLFINTAHQYGCKIHLLGCTDFNILKYVNLGKEDSADSTTWLMGCVYQNIPFALKNGTTMNIELRNLPHNISAKFEIISYYTYKDIIKYYDALNNYVEIKGE